MLHSRNSQNENKFAGSKEEVMAYAQQADLYYASGDTVAACEVIKQALRHLDGNVQLVNVLCDILMKFGDKETVQ